MVACRRDPGGQRTVGRQLHEEEMNTQSVCVGGVSAGSGGRREAGLAMEQLSGLGDSLNLFYP